MVIRLGLEPLGKTPPVGDSDHKGAQVHPEKAAFQNFGQYSLRNSAGSQPNQLRRRRTATPGPRASLEHWPTISRAKVLYRRVRFSTMDPTGRA